MGAYLSQPVTKKVSSDGENEYLTYGDSSMQGWRVSQEDAHNSIPDFLPGCSLFAVYDGHGGHEVAAYTAETLPTLIRKHPLYKGGQVREGLRQAFLEFDETLTKPETIDKLKTLAGRDAESEEEEEADREVDELFQEAHMPLDQLMAKYTGGGGGGAAEKKEKPAAAGVARLRSKDKGKALSPFLRAKAGGSGSNSSSSGGEDVADGPAASEGAIQKDLTSELSDDKDEGDSNAEAESKKEQKKPPSQAETSVGDGGVVVKPESGDVDVKKDVKSDDLKSEEKPKTNGSDGSGDADSGKESPDVSVSKEKTETASDETPSATTEGSGDSKPVVNGNGSTGNGAVESSDPADAAVQKTPKKGGKGARPGSGKSPAPAAALKAAAAAKAPKPSRKMPERAAAEIYRGVLAGARLAKEAGVVEDEAEDEEEEEADEDFSMEQSDSVEDDDAEDSDEAEEDEEEEEEEEDSDDTQDDAEETAEEEEDFMMNMKDEPGSDSGCTAVVALLQGRELYVANIGDSRCVLSRSGRAVDMSADHKPEDEPELQRIVKAGGKVTLDGRVNGGLNLSRAFGDHAYKTSSELRADEQMISASPDVRCVTIEPGTDEFMVLACDGIWNSKRSQEVVDFVSERIRERGETKLSNICEELFMDCLAFNTMGDGTGCDNMTCIIVRFLPTLANVKAPSPSPAPETSAESDTAATNASSNGDSSDAKRDNGETEGDRSKREDGETEADRTEDGKRDDGESEADKSGDAKPESEETTEVKSAASAALRSGDELPDQPPGKRQRTE